MSDHACPRRLTLLTLMLTTFALLAPLAAAQAAPITERMTSTKSASGAKKGTPVKSPKPKYPRPTATAWEKQVVALTNQARRTPRMCGKQRFSKAGPLTINPLLTAAARSHSADMSKRHYFSHFSLTGKSPWDRMNAAGYRNWTNAGENIAAGQSSPAAVVKAWLRSPGHCANIMNRRFTEIGVGQVSATHSYRYWWTQDFGRR